MIAFWILAALISAAAVLLILARAAWASGRVEAEAPTLAVYRRQLSEIDDLADRGLLGGEEQRAAHAEAGRRLLKEADRVASQSPAPVDDAGSARGRRIALIGAVLAPLLAMTAYLAVGSPGMPDQPFAKRMKVWRAADPSKLDLPKMEAVLRAIVAERPGDPQPLIFLARVELAQDNGPEAARALQRAAAIAPNDAEVWSTLGEARTMLADGQVTPDARAAFARALALNPAAPAPRYYLARARIAGGDLAGGLADWKALVLAMPADDPRRAALQAEIAQVSRTGALPAAEPQASQAPPNQGADQAAFIQAMVDRLAARLKANPDDPAGWARLIRAYGVLGKTAARDGAISQARRLFKDRPADLKTALDVAAPSPPP